LSRARDTIPTQKEEGGGGGERGRERERERENSKKTLDRME